MWATQNPTEKLFFVVVRDEFVKQTSLLEMELKDFFHQQHNLHNVEVIGLPTESKDTIKSLSKMMTSMQIEIPLTSWRFKLPFISRAKKGCWMVDELVLPKENDRKQFTKVLEQLQTHFEAQPARPPLWIACAGILDGRAENFEGSYLTSILPPAFHLPEMDVPLRNTKQTLAMAGLEGNKGVKGLDRYSGQSTNTNPVYKVPSHLMEGLEGKEFLVNDPKDEEEVASVV